MELLRDFKQNGYFNAELYHLLAKKKYSENPDPIVPSEYLKQMSISATERIQQLKDIEVDNLTCCQTKHKKDPILSFSPKIIIFQNVKPNEKASAKFTLKNKSTTPVCVTMGFKSSPFFFIKFCGSQLLSRLAPGISLTFSITYIPALFEDKIHRVTFTTDKEIYVVPIIAFAPRLMINFPNQVIVPKVALKVESSIITTIKNVGAVAGGITFRTRSPFSVKPKSVFVQPGDNVDIRIAFQTMHHGDIEGKLFALYETGESFVINLGGSTHTVNIELEKTQVWFTDTFNTMRRQQTFKITNRSSTQLTYVCMKNNSVVDDFEDKLKMANIFYTLKQSEVLKDNKLVHYDILSSEEHERVYTRIFYDEIQALVADESLLFQNTNFSIDPIQGSLWPNKTTELSISFSPQEIGELEVVAYLDIEGIPERVPLKLVGTSLAPNIQLNIETLNMDQIYINETYNYEVVAINKGHINGAIVYKEAPVVFGSIITCTPAFHCLKPGDKEIFVISFCNANQGPYFEELHFVIRDTNVLHKLYLKGEIIYPSLTFSSPCLDFGNVSLGIPRTLEFDVINESVVEVKAFLKIAGDGPEVNSITLEDYAVGDFPKAAVPEWPREFKIEPCKIYMTPESRLTLKVTLTANLVRANHTSLEMELEKSDSAPIVLPVTFNAVYPKINPVNDLKLPVCFMDYPYQNEICFKSDDAWGYFTVVEPEISTELQVNFKVKEGFIQPNSTVCLPVEIKTEKMGEHEYSIRIHLFGVSQLFPICNIFAKGVRPIVTCIPTSLIWGPVKVLTRSTKSLNICNDSPVKVHFRAGLLNRDGKWQIEPSEGYLPPESDTELLVTLYLIDAISCTNKLMIRMDKDKEICVHMSATGVGSSIVVGELHDRIDLGRHFTKAPLSCPVIIQNCGSRLHVLEFCEFYKPPKSEQRPVFFFDLEPKVMKIGGGESIELTVSGLSAKATTIRETWFLIGSVEGVNKKELLMECPITAEFVDPKLEISLPSIEFRYDYGPYSEFYKLTEIVTIKNVSKLPLHIEVSVRSPFTIIEKKRTYKITREQESECCCIRYLESDVNTKKLKEYDSRRSKGLIDYLTLQPVPPVQQGSLNFFQDIHKIKAAFNFTYLIEEHLEDEDVMAIQLVFDITKHTHLKSKAYFDLLRIKFVGLKNRDSVKLAGKINFPNIVVFPTRIDFHCIVNDSFESKILKIQNVTPLLACYRFLWKKCIITASKPPVPIIVAPKEDSPVTLSNSLDTLPTAVADAVEKISTTLINQGTELYVSEEGGAEKYSATAIVNAEPNLDMNQKVSIVSVDRLDTDVSGYKEMMKVAAMIDRDYDADLKWTHKFPELKKENRVNLNDILILIPHRGLLQPDEIQFVQVVFTPTRNIDVKAVLECDVLGGPPECIVITGQSSDINFEINTYNLNFKIRPFHMNASEKIIITNKDLLAFEYKTYLNEPVFQNELEGTILKINPPEKMLDAYEEAQMEVVMRPGVVGYFNRTFLLEIGYFSAVSINVFGWGCISQIYITTQKHDLSLFPDFLPYLAIADLTTEYMEAVSEFFEKNDFPKTSNTPNEDKCVNDPFFTFEWEIITSWEGVPTVTDLELALERYLVISHMKLHPEILLLYSNRSKTGPIPSFRTMPCIVDFGVVMTGSTVYHTSDVINYGPSQVKLRFSKGTFVPPFLNFKLSKKLNPGETGKMDVTFSPSVDVFTESEETFEIHFNLEVPYGVTIPLVIRALCAVPYLVSSVPSIDFGAVRCGDKRICAIPLKNIGKPTCIWFVALRSKNPGINPITVLNTSGRYEPGEGGWLSVSFKPTMEMLFEACLVFRFHMNPNKMLIPVKGYGTCPRVQVIGANVTFPPTLPWAATTKAYFGITNPCPFPIELVFAHSDKFWIEEEHMYQLLYKYYEKPEEMLVPKIKPGNLLPPEVIKFCNYFTAEVQRELTLEVAAAQKAAVVSKPATSRKAKSPKPQKADKSKEKKVEKEVRKFRTEAEISADLMRTLKARGTDPLKESLQIQKSAKEENSDKKASNRTSGILIIFHAAPSEEINSKEMACFLGKSLGLPTISIDTAFVYALCKCSCIAQETILLFIEETFDTIVKHSLKSSDAESNGEEEINEFDDEFDKIWKKIDLISKSKIATPRSKTPDKKKVASTSIHTMNATVSGGATLFQQELVQELLTVYFSLPQFNRGFIVESLTSLIIRSPVVGLTTILKSKLSSSYINLVLNHTDFNKWSQRYEETLRMKDMMDNPSKVFDDEEIHKIIRDVEEMTAEEYEELTPELKEIYITYGLEERKQKYGIKTAEGKKVKTASKITVKIPSPILDKKKPKKDDMKSAVKLTNEYIIMNSKYNDYTKNIYENLINIANNWIIEEGELGHPLYTCTGQLVGVAQKKTKVKSEVQLMEEVKPSERGFPLTFVMCPGLQYKYALLWMFKSCPEVQQVLTNVEELNILELPQTCEQYSVLLPKTKPEIFNEESLQWQFFDELPLKKCDCNLLNELMVLDDTNQDEIFNNLSKWHCVCGKKMISSQTSTTGLQSPVTVDKITNDSYISEETFYPLPLDALKSISELESRVILEPGDLMRCEFTYTPKVEGNFHVKRYVEVLGWPESRVTINALAKCDIPRIDSRPKKMFEDFVRRSIEDEDVVIYKHTFLDDRKYFDFGPIFIGGNRVYEEQYEIDLRNSSLMTADIEIEFKEPTNVFIFGEDSIMLEPGGRCKLKITAAPTEVGIHSSELLFCIKNNPEVVIVTIVCRGVVPLINILPHTKEIDCGKLLLYRRHDDRFIVKNESILPILWKLRNPEIFSEDFIITQTSGIVKRQDNQVVPITYIACKVDTISRRNLLIDIYDAEGRGEPMVCETLFFSAECYDVLIECAYEDPFKNYLNYGNVKVNSTEYRNMYMMNSGKYPVYYSLKKVKKFPQPALLKSFAVSKESGVLLPSLKTTVVEFECTPTTSMNLLNVPAYTCSLLDGSKEQIVVAEFPICVTLASFYNTFTLFPLGELNFGVVAVGVAVTREVIINNTSKCPFTFEILLPLIYQTDPLTIPAKGKDNKIKCPPLRCGNFNIASVDNLMAPGTSRSIMITFLGTASRKFEEIINFIISDTCPAEASGVPLKLIGVGAMPSLDIWNIDTTFREHIIVKSVSEYETSEPTPHCVFAEDSVTLHFFCVTVLSSFTATIDLFNNGLVPCSLTMQLQYQANSNADIFSLDKYETLIEPLSHKNLDIIFTPKALEEYRAVLCIKLKLLEDKTQLYTICLVGEGNIPRIQMLSPTVGLSKIGEVNFPVTCLGSITNKAITFENISNVQNNVILEVLEVVKDRPEFCLSSIPYAEQMSTNGDDQSNNRLFVKMMPRETTTVFINFNPIRRGKSQCEVKLLISENPFEHYTVLCAAEAFMEDVILLDLQMLSMDMEETETFDTTASTIETKGKRSPDKKKTKSKVKSQASLKTSDSSNNDSSTLKYLLDFGGCEISALQKRSIIMVNNSEKVYKFVWMNTDQIVIKPFVGYLSPGEEKDIEIIFFSSQPVNLKNEILECCLSAIRDETLTMNMKDSTWDSRLRMIVFDRNPDLHVNERQEKVVTERDIIEVPRSDSTATTMSIIILYSAITEFTKFECDLDDRVKILDTFIYQNREIDFTVTNIGNVEMKISWLFHVDKHFPAVIDARDFKNDPNGIENLTSENEVNNIPPQPNQNNTDKEEVQSLFSGSLGRESVDTWFEIDSPFVIQPAKACIKSNTTQNFKITFAPVNAFAYKICLMSAIENLDPYDQNISCSITATSLVPYVHLDMEDSDYLTSGRRKVVGVALPEHIYVLEFNVLGTGCYKKSFNIVNPTSEGYEFAFESVLSDKPELIPVHCDTLKGFIEGGTSTEITFTFAPTAPVVYESHWKLLIPVYDLVIDLLVVGVVRLARVVFVPAILIIRNSLVDFTTTNTVVLKNPENESLKFEFKGNSLCDESGRTPVIVEPNEGVLKPCSDTTIKIIYTPVHDGPISFKIFCDVQHMTKIVTLCVKALSFSICPKVTYSLFGYDHILNPDAITNIHLDQTASTYERTIPFVIKNEGSATFCYIWNLTCATVKKYLTVEVIPNCGHVAPASQVECILHFNLRKIPVQSFPVSLSITDGPEYSIQLFSEILKPNYYFTHTEYDFGKCIVNAPDGTYKKVIRLVNDDVAPIIVSSTFVNIPELLLHFHAEKLLQPGEKMKLLLYFRPKQIKEYEFKLQFWINSMCEEILTVKGEGVPLLFDLYEGCQKSFNLGNVKLGSKIVKQIEVMNHSKVTIEATLHFKDMYPAVDDDDINVTDSAATSICLDPDSGAHSTGALALSRVEMLQAYKDSSVKTQITKDKVNALSSVKVVPNKVTIKPHRKVPLKIHFKPIGLISNLDVQLNMTVLENERPLVRLSGKATGMSLYLSQTSLQFGCVRRKGCKVLKVMLINNGDFGSRFCWQPLISDEFSLSPMHGDIAARSNITFTITFRPKQHNPFVKIWACCCIDDYEPVELSMFATCIDTGNVQIQTVHFSVPVRESCTEFVTLTNPSDDLWLVLSEINGESFETLKEFKVEPNSQFSVPIYFKPRTMGICEGQVLYAPLGENALFLTLIGMADTPSPNGNIEIEVQSKEWHTVDLKVHNCTETPETYNVFSEVTKIEPDKFDSYYELNHPEIVKVWGDAAASCRWSCICFAECTMHIKVTFVNVITREYQFYLIVVRVTPSGIVDTIEFVSRARESIRKELVFKNPLGVDIEFNIITESLIVPDTLKISKNSKANLVMIYSPLVVGEKQEYLEANNELTGSFIYKIICKCLPAKIKKLHLTTAFGTSIPKRLRVVNQREERADFIAKTSHPSILIEKEYSIGSLDKGKFLVWFEPTEMGIQECQVSFDSPTAGKFVFEITGEATSPKPQGPFEIADGTFTFIKFKNVYNSTQTFQINIDSSDFRVISNLEEIGAKKEIKIKVSLQDDFEKKYRKMPTACLTIECISTEPHVHWTYFLQGVV